MISSDIRKAGPYAGNGATTVFPFAFKVFKASDVQIIFTAASGSDTTLTGGYTVSLNANQDIAPGGSITMTTPHAEGTKLTILSAVAALQPLQLTNGGGFFPAVINAAFDRITIVAQQIMTRLDRALLFPASETGLTIPGVLQRAGRLLGFDSAGGFKLFGPGEFKGDPGANVMAIGLFTAAPGMAIPAATDLVQTSGHTVRRRGAARYGWDSTKTAADVVGNALRYMFIAADGRVFTLCEDEPTPQMFGAVVDGVKDDFAPLQVWLYYGGALLLPAGAYRSSQRLEVRNLVHVRGVGYGFNNQKATYLEMQGSRIVFPANCPGIIVRPQTLQENVYPPTQFTLEGGFNSTFSDFGLIGGAGTSLDCHAFESRTRVYVRNVRAVTFAGTGFRLAGSSDAPQDGTPYGNVSGSSIMDCYAYGMGGHGFHVHGRDASVVSVINCDASVNSMWGHRSETILGATWIGCHAAGNGLGAFWAQDGVEASTFLNCYTEGFTGSNHYIGFNHNVIGGTGMGVDLIGPTGPALRGGNQHPQPAFTNVGYRTAGTGSAHYVGVGDGNLRCIGFGRTLHGVDALMSWGAQPTDLQGDRDGIMDYSPIKGYFFGAQRYHPNMGATGNYMYWPDDGKSVNGRLFGVELLQGAIVDGVLHKATKADGSIPNGIYERGDVLANKAAAPGGFASKVCTAGGVLMSAAWANGENFYSAPVSPWCAWYRVNAGNVYKLIASDRFNIGSPSTVAPTHTAGDVKGDDTMTWRFMNAVSAVVFKGAGAIEA